MLLEFAADQMVEVRPVSCLNPPSRYEQVCERPVALLIPLQACVDEFAEVLGINERGLEGNDSVKQTSISVHTTRQNLIAPSSVLEVRSKQNHHCWRPCCAIVFGEIGPILFAHDLARVRLCSCQEYPRFAVRNQARCFLPLRFLRRVSAPSFSPLLMNLLFGVHALACSRIRGSLKGGHGTGSSGGGPG